jgi:hypothetical protein
VKITLKLFLHYSNWALILFQPNAAGQKYLDLFHKTWKTYFVHSVNPGHTVHTSAFLGDYLLNIKKNGHLIHQENFTLDKSGKDITIHLTGKVNK